MTQHGNTVVVIDISEDGTTKLTWIATRRDNLWTVISQTFSNIKSTEAK